MAIEFKDYYALLGVPRTATDEEIKRAFRRLARVHHPDVAKDKRTAEEKFKEINEAYEVLSNAENRRKYDQLGPGWRAGAEFRPPPGGGYRTTRRRGTPEEEVEFQFGGTGFSEFFESLFGGRTRGFEEAATAGRGRSGRRRGGDIESDILVHLDEVLHGSLRMITQERVGARGGRTERHSFQVRIPPGVREGQLIRVAGKGEPGPGGEDGDLYLRVKVAVSPDFEVRDHDLWTEVALAPWEAVLGATVPVPSLEGPLSVRVPLGARNGQQLRVRGRGLPTPDGSRGDLYAVVTIEVPAQVTDEERALWQRLAELSSFNPRRGAQDRV